MKPRAYIFICQIMTQLLNIHLIHCICCFARKENYRNTTSSYRVLKHKLNLMKSFSTALEEMFECWKYEELCEDLLKRDKEKHEQKTTEQSM